ncbi:protein transport protein Sec24B-like [Oppia nitens]|uniref:protein transport protein Sec24B-like n=1 Tax=Oppia nitens TaxID=1686743 RepID=UPI0023DBF7B2|nr:protein transport protein Sec24B-like [Oppia nitens]
MDPNLYPSAAATAPIHAVYNGVAYHEPQQSAPRTTQTAFNQSSSVGHPQLRMIAPQSVYNQTNTSAVGTVHPSVYNQPNVAGINSSQPTYNGVNYQSPPPLQPNVAHHQQPQQPIYNQQPSRGQTLYNGVNYNDSTSYQTQPQVAQQQQHQPVYNGLNYQQQQPSVDPLTTKMAGMSVNQTWGQMWSQESVNLMTEKDIRTKSVLSKLQRTATNESDMSCNKEILRSTLTKVPDSASLLQKTRLPFGILLHPFKEDEDLPVIQDSTIVRCRSCRTYINPYVRLLDQRRWQCNLCLRINEIPDDFLYDHNTRQMLDPTLRPELNYDSIEYIASVEYMVRPPQPAAYLFVFDCSRHATQIGYIPSMAKIIKESLDNIPGDSRALIGFIAFDSKLHFFNLGDKQPIHLVLPDIQDVFLPNCDNILVNLHSKRAQIDEFLTEILPNFPLDNPNDVVYDSGSALGAALTIAYKVLSSLGGRITLIQAALPNTGNPNDGSVLTNREDPNKRAANANNLNALTPLLNPGTDFYKKLSLECSEHQIAVDLFNLSTSYSDLATVGSISKFSGGSIHYYGGSPPLCLLSRFEADLRHYLERNIGFEAVMRLRCTRGISIHTFHGNFFVRSTDLLALPNVNPDSGYAMQISIDDDLKDYSNVCFQAAILYTSATGERRIRVHTLSLPVVTTLNDVTHSADQEAIVGLICKMAVDRSFQSSMSDAREALINSVVDILNTYRSVNSNTVSGGLVMAASTKLMPLYVLALIKHIAFRVGISTKIDERVFAMERIKSLPLKQLMLYIYPNLYPIHNSFTTESDRPTPVQLSFANIDRNGVYLLDTYDNLFVYICKSVHPQWLSEVLNVTQWAMIPDDGDLTANQTTPNIATPVSRIQQPIQPTDNRSIIRLPQLENMTSKRIHQFINSLIQERPFQPNFYILREDSRLRYAFLQYMYDDRNESAFSYYEFLQHLQQQIKN